MTLAWTFEPGSAGSARIEHHDEPPGTGEMVVEALAVGICGTDRDILAGEYGTPAPGNSASRAAVRSRSTPARSTTPSSSRTTWSSAR